MAVINLGSIFKCYMREVTQGENVIGFVLKIEKKGRFVYRPYVCTPAGTYAKLNERYSEQEAIDAMIDSYKNARQARE